jgi:hypothetical protein
MRMEYDQLDVVAPWDRDLRRARSLARDESRLRQALAAHEGRRFDVDTAQVLRERTEDLLETVDAIAHDDDFWERLERAAAEPLTADQLDRLRELDGTTLAVLLEASGYATPPPPPVDELVDDTIADLATALDAAARPLPDAAWGQDDQRQRVRAAQNSLITFTWRVRKQVTELTPSPLEPSLLRASARRLGGAARWLLPKVAAVSAGVLVESVVPGTGIGLVVGAAAKKVAEEGVELAATLAAARIPDGTQDSPARVNGPPSGRPLHPVFVHSAALIDQLHGLEEAGRDATDAWPDDSERDVARRAARHLRRLEEVMADADRLDPDARLGIQEIARVLDRYLGPAPEARPDLGTADHAAHWLADRAKA